MNGIPVPPLPQYSSCDVGCSPRIDFPFGILVLKLGGGATGAKSLRNAMVIESKNNLSEDCFSFCDLS